MSHSKVGLDGRGVTIMLDGRIDLPQAGMIVRQSEVRPLVLGMHGDQLGQIIQLGGFIVPQAGGLGLNNQRLPGGNLVHQSLGGGRCLVELHRILSRVGQKHVGHGEIGIFLDGLLEVAPGFKTLEVVR